MTTHIGKEGSITVGGNVVAEMVDFNFTERVTLVLDTALGEDWETHQNGTKSWDGGITAMLDPDDTLGQEALTNGASVALVLLVEGTATGKARYSGTVTIEEIGVAVTNNNEVTNRSFTFKGNGAMTIDAVP